MQDFYSGLVYGLMVVLVSFILMAMNYILGSRYNFNRSGMTAFECGFDAMSSARSPFSFRYFLLAILFLAFDMEVSLLLFFVWGKVKISSLSLCKCGVFVGILLVGLLHELNEGSLSWVEEKKEKKGSTNEIKISKNSK